MKRKILFILGGLLNFYVFPVICYQTMEGDKGISAWVCLS